MWRLTPTPCDLSTGAGVWPPSHPVGDPVAVAGSEEQARVQAQCLISRSARVRVLILGAKRSQARAGPRRVPASLAPSAGSGGSEARSPARGAILGRGGTIQSARGRRGRRVARESPRAAPGAGLLGSRGLASVPPCCTVPAASRWEGTGSGRTCGLEQLTFSQRLLTWDSESCLHSFSCSIHWSSSLVNNFSSMMPPARIGCLSALLPRRRPHPGHTHTPTPPLPGVLPAAPGGCWALAPARWLAPQCSAAGRCTSSARPSSGLGFL